MLGSGTLRVETTTAAGSKDDLLTLAALGIVAYIFCDLGHEIAGHGGVCLATGGQPASFSTTHFQCLGGWQPAITAAGILFNITFGATLWLTLRKERGLSSPMRHFLWLTMAYNLFSGWGYLVQSSVTDSGDWANFLRLTGQTGWRWSMIPVGIAGYYWSLRTTKKGLESFVGGDGSGRVWRLVYVPYLVAAWIPIAVRAFNSTVSVGQLASALAGSLLFAWGFLALPLVVRRKADAATVGRSAAGLTRKPGWLLLAVTILVFFVGTLGPGVRLTIK
jgi:hypothetical protein